MMPATKVMDLFLSLFLVVLGYAFIWGNAGWIVFTAVIVLHFGLLVGAVTEKRAKERDA